MFDVQGTATDFHSTVCEEAHRISVGRHPGVDWAEVVRRWQQADRAMRRGEPLPRQPTPAYLAVGLSVVGLVALGLVIAKVVMG